MRCAKMDAGYILLLFLFFFFTLKIKPPAVILPPGQFVLEHHTLPGHKSRLMAPDHLGGIEFDIQLLWSAQTFDSPYQLWRATSSYSRSVH